MFDYVWLALATWRVKHWACCDTNKTINTTMCTASSSCAYLTLLIHAYSLFGFVSNILKHKMTPLTYLLCSTQWAKINSKGTPQMFFILDSKIDSFDSFKRGEFKNVAKVFLKTNIPEIWKIWKTFSRGNFMFNTLRTNLSGDNFDKLLLLNCNKDLWIQ